MARATRSVGVGAVFMMVTTACVSQEARGTPLYPGSSEPRPRSEVALLTGPIKSVDGKPLTGGGSSFELLPGCHVVEIGGRVGSLDPAQGGFAATVPQMFYAIQMAGGGTYSIEFEFGPSAGQGPLGSGRIAARARDASGAVRELEPATDPAMLESCHRREVTWETTAEPQQAP